MRRIAGWVLCACFVAPVGARADQQLLAQDLKRLSLEELAELDIISAARRAERLTDVPAAVTIITDEYIRRSGASTLAEAMRLAGVLDVARVHGNSWAVSARGFTITTANKLLVLIDGRTVYSPLSSGTFWDAQDLILTDIDRIEIVRGPGGSTWGANAVNGVINVITKPAAATRGTFVGLGAGSVDHFIASIRHGGRLGASGSYRVYGKYRDRGPLFLASGPSAEDSQQFGQGGVRLESGLAGANQWFVQGDVYRGVEGLLSRDDADIAGGNVLGRWTRRFSNAEFQGQVYYDRTFRHVPQQFQERRNTFDIEALHRLRSGGRHEFVVGGNVRVTHGRDIGSAGFRFVPEERTNALVSAFVQDDIVLRPDRVFLRVGSKFERNDFTGLEVQPAVRVRVSPGPRQMVWAAVSRAVRLPTRFDTDLQLVNPLTGTVTLTGREDFDSESVVAYEGGYRLRPHARAAFDVSVFANRYDDLRSVEPPSVAGEPSVLGNLQNAFTSGVELIAVVQPHDRWRVRTTYAYLHSEFSLDPGSRDPFGGANEANDPSHQLSLWSFVDLPLGFQLDALARLVGRRPSPPVDRYAELDLRGGWTVRPGWDLSIIGQNLLHARHAELFGGGLRYVARRGIHVRSTWRF
jgi:iron complex outermembrane receptor protein